MKDIINLEAVCAKYGFEIANSGNLAPTDKENVINKALGVLAENGFYALSVFLLSCSQPSSGKEQPHYGTEVERILVRMLASEKLGLILGKDRGVAELQELRGVTEDLPRLILARRVTEQALTFARYHCKAKAREDKRKEGRQ